MTTQLRRQRGARRYRRIIGLLAATGVGLPLLAAGVLGMPVMQALLIGAVGVALVAPWARPPQPRNLTFPEEPRPQSNRGIRREAFQLSWSVATSDHRVGTQLTLRIRRIAERRLAATGLDLSDPADQDPIVARIGDPAYQIVSAPAGREISRRDFRTALAAVEHLGPAAANPVPHHQPRKDN